MIESVKSVKSTVDINTDELLEEFACGLIFPVIYLEWNVYDLGISLIRFIKTPRGVVAVLDVGRKRVIVNIEQLLKDPVLSALDVIPDEITFDVLTKIEVSLLLACLYNKQLQQEEN